MTIARVGRGVLAAVLLPVVLLAIWWVASAGSTTYYFPPLSKVFSVFDDTWFHGRVGADIVPSVVRIVIGYLLAVLVGVGLGVVIGSYQRVRQLTEPVLEFMRAIPPPVLVPVLILFFGIGDVMKVVVIFSGALWPILLNTVEGVRGVDEVLRETCRCYGIRGPARIWHLVVRSASPQIAAGMRQGLSIAIILMVISEMFASENGLGKAVITFQRQFEVAGMWTGIIILSLLGLGFAMLLQLFEWRTLRWYRGLREAQRGRS